MEKYPDISSTYNLLRWIFYTKMQCAVRKPLPVICKLRLETFRERGVDLHVVKTWNLVAQDVVVFGSAFMSVRREIRKTGIVCICFLVQINNISRIWSYCLVLSTIYEKDQRSWGSTQRNRKCSMSGEMKSKKLTSFRYQWPKFCYNPTFQPQ